MNTKSIILFLFTIFAIILANLFVVDMSFSETSSTHKENKENKEHKKHAKDSQKGKKKDGHSDHKASVKKVGKKKLIVQVEGMVCAFCAQGVQKNFNKLEEVKSTKVDLDNMQVTITLKPEKTLSEKQIREVVTGAGFVFVGMN